MAIRALKCPSCNGDISLDDSKEFGFCLYCGTKIMLKDIIEVKGKVEFEGSNSRSEMLQRGITYIRLNDYKRAGETFSELLNKYPDCADGYYQMTLVKTRSLTSDDFSEPEINSLIDKMMLMSGGDNRFEDYKKNVLEFINGRKDRKQAEFDSMVRRYAESLKVPTYDEEKISNYKACRFGLIADLIIVFLFGWGIVETEGEVIITMLSIIPFVMLFVFQSSINEFNAYKKTVDYDVEHFEEYKKRKVDEYIEKANFSRNVY